MDEKLKKALECCINSKCSECPLFRELNCDEMLVTEVGNYIAELEERIAIMQESMEALEKRNEPVKPEAFMDDTEKRYRCKCGKVLMKGFRYHWNYCPKCGQAVKWE